MKQFCLNIKFFLDFLAASLLLSKALIITLNLHAFLSLYIDNDDFTKESGKILILTLRKDQTKIVF